jgi:cell division protein FtsW (lipid II flippase)
VSARNRELIALIPASLLLSAGFAAVFLQRNEFVGAQGTNRLTTVSLTYGAIFLGLCLVVHLFLRWRLPHADPYLFPLAATLACFGLVFIYRIDKDLAADQARWFFIGIAAFCATIFLLKDYRVLERYRYVIALASLLLLMLPLLPGIGETTNGANLSVRVGSLSFQPGEFAKIGIIIFLASYLRDTRQLLTTGGRQVMGVNLPPLRQLAPLLVVFGAAMMLLLVIKDLGTSLMFFGGFLAVLYVATNRVAYPAIGLGLFAAGAYFIGSHTAHVKDRIDAWHHPFESALYNAPGGSYQLAQGLFSQADGGLFGTGVGQALLVDPSGRPLLPAPQTDLIYAVITNELGLAGAVGLLVVYLLFAERGFKTAVLARDSFSKLLATGLTAVFALQVFVIVGGVTKTIPLTGVTLPFVSYGGSSIVANFVLLALLLMVSDRSRRPA